MCLRQCACIVFCAFLLLSACAAQADAAEWRHRNIWLKNEWGERITPARNTSDPYSPRRTCGTCHGYSTITSGYHFQQGFDEMRDGYDKRRPWILSPGLYGKGCIPGTTSGRVARKKNSSLKDMDLSAYDWIGAEGKFGPDGRILSAACGWIHPGGGPLEYGRSPDGRPDFSRTLARGEPRSETPLDGDYSSRHTPDKRSHFRESGVVEGDCLLCHSGGYSLNRRNAQIGRRNYGWAATAGAGLGEIRGSVFEYRDARAGPDDPLFAAGSWNFTRRPSVRYSWGNRNLFTKEGRLSGRLIDRRVRSVNCLQCHRDTEARKSGTLFEASFDVHIAAGFQCTDCHGLAGKTKARRLRHNIAKGWSPEGTVKNSLDGAGLKTCAGCHLQDQYRQVREDLPREAKNPEKVHREKFPRASSHFNLLHCTACHATAQPGRGIYLHDAGTGEQTWYTADTLHLAGPRDVLSKPAAKPWSPWVMRFEKTRGDGEKYLPCLTRASQWFGEKQANGEVRPIALHHVRRAFGKTEGLTAVEVRNLRGEKVRQPTVAAEKDIRIMVQALSNMGFKQVVFVADRIYEVRQGKVVALNSVPLLPGQTFPVHSGRIQWFGEKQRSGGIRPISNQYVLQAFRTLQGISMTEGGSAKGTKAPEPTVATNADILLVIRSLSEKGFRNAVYVGNRLYEMKDGKLRSSEVPPQARGALQARRPSQRFGEKLESGAIKPIGVPHIRKVLDDLRGLTVAEIRNARGEKVWEPTIATEKDIRGMIRALTGLGYNNVVFVADRIYALQDGKLVSSAIAPAMARTSFPVFHNVLPVEKKKTYGAKGKPDGCLDCHGDNAPFFTRLKIVNAGRFLRENYPTAKEPNAEPQMYEWGILSVPAYE